MYCTRCGRLLRDTARFCGGCGTVIASRQRPANADQLSSQPVTTQASRSIRSEIKPTGGNPKLHAPKRGNNPDAIEIAATAKIGISNSPKALSISRMALVAVAAVVIIAIGFRAIHRSSDFGSGSYFGAGSKGSIIEQPDTPNSVHPKNTWGDQPNGPPDTKTQWDKPFASPQYLCHAPAEGADADYYFLSDKPANENGEVEIPMVGGATTSQKTDFAKGPLNTPRDVCEAAAGVSMGPLSTGGTGPFDCAQMPKHG